MKRILKSTAITLGAALAATTLLTGVAQAKPDPGGPPCGFYKTATQAHYNHCWFGGPGDMYIRIDINAVGGGDSLCIGPGDYYIGPANAIVNVSHRKGDKSCLT